MTRDTGMEDSVIGFCLECAVPIRGHDILPAADCRTDGHFDAVPGQEHLCPTAYPMDPWEIRSLALKSPYNRFRDSVPPVRHG